MRFGAGACSLILALGWAACEDRSFELAEGGSGGGDAGPNPSSDAGVDGSQDDDDDLAPNSSGSEDSTTGSSGGSENGSSTSGNMSFGCFDCEGSGGSGNQSSVGNGGRAGTGGNTGSGNNQGGQAGDHGCAAGDPHCAGCSPDDYDCLICSLAISISRCEVPTPDCRDAEYWSENCQVCSAELDPCSNGTRCFDTIGRCRIACDVDEECSYGEVCDPEARVCVRCSSEAPCPQGQHCLAGRCVQCITTEDCPSYQPHCIAGKCFECVSSNDCRQVNKPFCNVGYCSDCRTAMDCQPGQACNGINCYWPL